MLKCARPISMAVTVIALSGALLLVGTACGKEESTEIIINAPVEIPYFTRNPIEVITDEKTEGDGYSRTITIKGLSDEKVQEGINNELKATYRLMNESELPPYRGIRNRISSDMVISRSYLDADVTFNYNNVASIHIAGSRAYGEVTVGVAEAYNINLVTGEEITLKDVFADDVDYKTLLNNAISKSLEKSNATEESEDYSYMGGGIKLVSPFKGISEHQKFYLDQSGICLIMDYGNPEFDLGFYPVTIYISFEELGDVVAVTKRFSDSAKDLYESSDSPVYEFRPDWYGNSIHEEKNQTIDKINVFQSFQYSTDIPDQALVKVKELKTVDQENLKEIKEKADTSLQTWNSLEQYVLARKFGKYTMVTRSISMSFNNQWKAENLNFCYDEYGNELHISDLFVRGYDYEAIVMKALEKAVSQMVPVSSYNMEDLYKELQFGIELSEISFATRPLKTVPNQEAPIYFSIPYEEIGCENLTLFNNLQ